MKKLSLEWKVLDKHHVALVFDIPTWKTFEAEANTRGIEASDMIAQAVIGVLGQGHAGRPQ